MAFFTKKIIFFAFFISSTTCIWAQDDPPMPGDVIPPPLPINEHIGFLLVGGLVLGIVMLYKSSKKASVLV